ncbi:MAG: hypothetical protein B1H08_02830 [Candidatus Omnitrophica bacterium 4484_171]|nr:MAG: hypothetical protein B1H08_02830 [Candidatus Omnitrophica bacterium 4484_171]
MKIKELYKKYSLPTYTRAGPVFVKGKGSWLWDEKGRRFLDLFPGWGVSILGHCHPGIVKAVSSQAHKLFHLPNNLYSAEQALLAEDIVKHSYPAKVFFANSGAEAVEGAVKLSRLYGEGKRYEIVTMKNSFHGRTMAALSATGQKKYKYHFRPLVPGFKEARFNDLGDLKKKITKKTVAVLLELIQGEGGVNVAQKEYIKGVHKICRSKNLLFIVDEVQTGMGRTAKLFCYEHYGITPDIMTLSKGLGAGIPVAAFVVKKSISSVITPGMHASTFGGSPFAARVSREVFNIIKKEKILDNVKIRGKHLFQTILRLKDKFPFIKEIRGMGLMLGIELSVSSYPFFEEALKRGLIINSTHGNVLRVMPALNIDKKTLDKGLDILEEVLKSKEAHSWRRSS